MYSFIYFGLNIPFIDWLSFTHRQFHSFTAHYRVKSRSIAGIALGSIAELHHPRPSSGGWSSMVFWSYLLKQVAREEGRQWDDPTTSVDAFSIVIIVYFIAWNLNFNILLKISYQSVRFYEWYWAQN
jgi:hypothetical protein